MKARWVVKPLKEVAYIGAGNPAPQDKADFLGGTLPFIRTSDVGQVKFGEISRSADLVNDACAKGLRLVPKGTILVPKSGASTFLNHRVITTMDAFVSSHLATVTAKHGEIDPRFLLYALSQIKAQDLLPENSYPSLNLSLLGAAKVSFPPLEEQKRIVAVLDEAFEGLDRARANAEANLADARALFVGYLRQVFARPSSGFKKRTIGEILQLQRGFDITKSSQREGSIPVVSSGGIRSYHCESMAQGPGVILGRKGSIGSVHFVEQDYWPHDTTLWVKDFRGNNERLVYFLFLCIDLKSLDTGAANPSLNRNLIHPIEIFWPDACLQGKYVAKLDEIHECVSLLEANAAENTQEFYALRQSLLRRAFSGELT